MFAWNVNKIFAPTSPRKKRKRTVTSNTESELQLEQSTDSRTDEEKVASVSQTILEAELDCLKKELRELKEQQVYQRTRYSVAAMDSEVLRMETGLPTKDVFQIVVNYISRFRDNINYYYGWRVDSIKLEDQVFITLMKLRQNHTNLHLAQLFGCSVTTVTNIVLTFVHVLHSLFFEDLMSSIRSRDKNKSCAPSSFSLFGNCRVIIDCTDVEIATPRLMTLQNATYSSYRGMNSFNAIVGVAPNGVITYVSKLFPGSVSDKLIVEHSGILKHFVTGDLVIADKGFLIQDIVPDGVAVNIPPFLNNVSLVVHTTK